MGMAHEEKRRRLNEDDGECDTDDVKYPKPYEECGEYGDGPNMKDYEGKSFEHFADEWEITKRTIAGKIRQLDKDELWDAIHALDQIADLESVNDAKQRRIEELEERFNALVARMEAMDNGHGT